MESFVRDQLVFLENLKESNEIKWGKSCEIIRGKSQFLSETQMQTCEAYRVYIIGCLKKKRSTSKEENNQFFMEMQQNFEGMNVLCREFKVRLDRWATLIAKLTNGAN